MEYRMSGGNKALLYIIGAGAFGGGVFAIIMAFQLGNPALLIPAIVGLGIGWLMYRLGSRLLVTIDENSITLCNGFTTKSVLLDEIAGFRSGSKQALVLVQKNGGRPLTLPGNLAQGSELRDWVRERYPDIDAQLAQEVTEEVLHDERYGLTEEDRRRRLSQARKLMLYSGFVVPLFFVWALIGRQPSKLLMLILLALPLTGVWLTWSYKGILRLYMSKAKPYPSLVMAVFIAELAGFFVVMRGFNIYLYDGRFWGLALALSVVVLLLWAAACRTAVLGEKNLLAVYAGMLILAGLYSYNVLIFSNCAYDKRPSAIWRVGVDQKHVNHGKSTTYSLELSPWGRFTDGKQIQVSYSFFRSVAVGDSVNVYLHPGKWGIAWYEVLPD